ncbi:hypothetical protein HDV01_004110 [Terramyces sp. JEL0728]|nr:hypothetical protein HDV01_004110 [Terramyces sp. JEL0728]
MNILVVGAGAVGCKYASHFRHSGNLVSLVCRSNYQAIKSQGVKFDCAFKGNYTFIPDNVFRSTTETVGNFDHVVVTTKATSNINLVELLKPVVAENTMIHLMQNGIGIENDVASSYPNNPVVSSIAYIASHQKEPGHVVVSSKITYFKVGLFKLNDADNTKLQKFVDDGVSGGLSIYRDDCIQRSRWWKLIWNGSFNPLSIVSGNKTCKEMLDDEYLHSLIRSLMTEVVTVANLVCPEKIPLEADITNQVCCWIGNTVIQLKLKLYLETQFFWPKNMDLKCQISK